MKQEPARAARHEAPPTTRSAGIPVVHGGEDVKQDVTVLQAARVFTGAEEYAPGEVVIRGDRIVRTGPADRTSAPTLLDLGTVTLVPGFVDVHCHGAAGVAVTDDPRAVLALHRAHGTTSLIASLVTEPLDVLHDQLRALFPFVHDGTLAGIHLEGPWLATAYRGAHAQQHLRDPDPAEVEALLETADGTVRMVTLAAERPGGWETIALLHEHGIVAALGHTAADHRTAVAAIDAG